MRRSFEFRTSDFELRRSGLVLEHLAEPRFVVALTELGGLFDRIARVDVDQFQRQQVIALVVLVLLSGAGGQLGEQQVVERLPHLFHDRLEVALVFS